MESRLAQGDPKGLSIYSSLDRVVSFCVPVIVGSGDPRRINLCFSSVRRFDLISKGGKVNGIRKKVTESELVSQFAVFSPHWFKYSVDGKSNSVCSRNRGNAE